MPRRNPTASGTSLSVALVACVFASLTACSATQRSTRMTSADFTDMSTRMAQSIAASPAVRQRTADSEPWTVSINKVQNLSSDVMTDSEQWAIIARLRGQLPIAAMRNERNIRFTIPPERVAQLRNDPNLVEFHDDQFGSTREPTHEMHATFRSVTRANAKNRTEQYYCEFEILDLRSGEPVWVGSYDLKRAAKGHVWD